MGTMPMFTLAVLPPLTSRSAGYILHLPLCTSRAMLAWRLDETRSGALHVEKMQAVFGELKRCLGKRLQRPMCVSSSGLHLLHMQQRLTSQHPSSP
jgi:hypothetical protein